MLLTKNIVKFNKLVVKILNKPKEFGTLAENRWGYKTLKDK